MIKVFQYKSTAPQLFW